MIILSKKPTKQTKNRRKRNIEFQSIRDQGGKTQIKRQKTRSVTVR